MQQNQSLSGWKSTVIKEFLHHTVQGGVGIMSHHLWSCSSRSLLSVMELVADKLCSDGKNCSLDMYVGSLFNYNSILDLTYSDLYTKLLTCLELVQYLMNISTSRK